MRKLIQIYTGGVSGRNISVQQIVQKLELVQKAGLDGIIVGWSLEKQIYEWLRLYKGKGHRTLPLVSGPV